MVIYDLTGKQFGRLTVLAKNGFRNYPGGSRVTEWLCRCLCGQPKLCITSNLLSGKTTHCGCDFGNRKPLKESSFNALINRYKQNAAHKGIEWCLSPEEAVSLFTKNCNYCGISPSNTYNVYKTKQGAVRQDIVQSWAESATILYNGIDRIDSSEDYTSLNTVSCCTTCNYGKAEMSVGEFTAFITRLTSFWPNRVALRVVITPAVARSVSSENVTPFNCLIARYKQNKKKKAWELTFEEALTLFKGNCYYCGSAPSSLYNPYVTKKGTHHSTVSANTAKASEITYNGIDKVDPTDSYHNKNVVSCCFDCNRAKNTLSLVQFECYIERLISYRGQLNVKDTK